MSLPALPSIDVRVLEELSPADPVGFLHLRRRRVQLCYPDGQPSHPFVFDCVERLALDAVVIAAHYVDDAGSRWVYLRSALRPAVRLRPEASRPFAEKPTLGALWELPAGLVEPDECSVAGLSRCAARELREELGFEVAPGRLESLGRATFPAPGIIGERHHYFHVAVSPSARAVPSEDGSVLEQRALIVAAPLAEALQLVARGEIEDAKTEIALRRLAEI